MNILVVAHSVPMPDRQTGMLRFSHILKILLKQGHHILFYAAEIDVYRLAYGDDEIERYRDDLISLGIEVKSAAEAENSILRRWTFDVVLFEHYDMVRKGYVDLSDIRFWQPRARILVDTVDVEFQRLESKAAITGSSEDAKKAKESKAIELMAYGKADVVITTSETDKRLLKRMDDKLRIEVIPLVHHIPALEVKPRPTGCPLVFVGNFELDANVDAMLYFARSIFPLIRRRIPNALLRIVGNAPPKEIRQLADDGIEVLGFVPNLAPIYAKSLIAVIPIRWGGGLKGKVIEAMSFGLPVVTTQKGIEGFALSPGTNVLVGDDPDSFAERVIHIFENQQLYEDLRLSGWNFARLNFGEASVANGISELFERIANLRVKRLPLSYRIRRAIPLVLDRYVVWRFRRGAPSKLSLS
jgi:O-antigen biosynthesis protein